jgi:nucleotide-binding universal stress UspA family protein
MFRSILVHVDGSGAEARVRLAARLAQAGGAHLTGAVARLPAPLLEVYAGGSAMISAGLMDVADDMTRDAFKNAEAAFRKALTGFSLETEWRTAVDFPAIAIASMAAAADIVVTGPTSSAETFDAGDVVMRAGRPVVVVPAEQDQLKAEKILVAWKNRREARRALSDALPFLREAKQVTLLHIVEAAEDDPATEDAVALLARHGVRAEVETVSAGKAGPSEQILAVAARKQCGLIVLGAYGHSRFREWAFGGVTRELLRSSAVPRLFSH